MDTIITIHTALPDVAGTAEPPAWVHLVPSGIIRTLDGRGPYVLQNAQAVIEASMANGAKLPIDENHAIDHSARTGQPSPARGYIVEMQARADGIWGRVEWTPSGVQLMAERAYRGFSPALAIKKGTNIVAGVVRGSLTNNPNLIGLASLNTQQDTSMDPKALRAALGLPETADDATVLARITANATAVTTHAAQLSAIAAAAGAKATDADALVIELQAVRANAGSADKLAATVVELQTKLDGVLAAGRRTAAETAIDAAIAAGKPIIPAIREHYITRHMADPESVARELAVMPSLHMGGIGGEQLVALQASGAGDGDELTPMEKMTCQKMGVDPKKFMENKKRKMMEGAA